MRADTCCCVNDIDGNACLSACWRRCGVCAGGEDQHACPIKDAKSYTGAVIDATWKKSGCLVFNVKTLLTTDQEKH